jgi:UDP-N-acetylglucosamine acyltransferase
VGNHSVSSAIERIKAEVPDGEVKDEILQFVQSSKAGLIKRYAKNGVDEN